MPTSTQDRRPPAALAALALALLLAATAARPAAAQETGLPEAGTFVSLSDLHFNPFYDSALVSQLVEAPAPQWPALFAGSQITAPSSYGKDTNYPLLQSTLAALRRFGAEPDFVLITGDFLGHDFPQLFQQQSPDKSQQAYREFVRKTLEFLTSSLQATFPGKPVFPALGNNDDFCGDYQIQPRGPFLSMLSRVWEPLLGGRPGTFAKTFPLGGFYSAPHPTTPKLRLVVLNTVFFSRKYKNACGDEGGDPGAFELGWLEGVLDAAARDGERVWLIDHVPPGIDVHSTLGNGRCPSTPVPLWASDDTTGFFQVIADNAGVVEAHFTGHIHMDEFRLPPAGGFVHGTPAVSPVYGNNPAFQVLSYERSSGALLDERAYFLNVAAGQGATPQWALEYDFRQAYGQNGYNAAALRSLQQSIASNPEIRNRYLTFYPASSSQSSTDQANWQAYWCGIGHLTPADFAACLCPSP
jgi:sphingomyelin phosphodiesterase acid-like 3